jgi:5-methylcytosine-specific restriction endonuclease McrBC regulatory subunit McrC
MGLPMTTEVRHTHHARRNLFAMYTYTKNTVKNKKQLTLLKLSEVLLIKFHPFTPHMASLDLMRHPFN